MDINSFTYPNLVIKLLKFVNNEFRVLMILAGKLLDRLSEDFSGLSV